MENGKAYSDKANTNRTNNEKMVIIMNSSMTTFIEPVEEGGEE